MDRETALEIVKTCLKDALEQFGAPTEEVTENTTIVGPSAVLDSISAVSLIVDIEQRLEMEHNIYVTLASEKAMSQKSSPFRTAGVLADHICESIKEGQAA
jgi:D-alanine--poly(phosphoribitol) ligase subunit 2